jgi:hypothetical protein
VLKREVQLATTPVRVQRFHFPLPFHPLAEAAARAAICGAGQGKAEEMADALFEQPLVDGVWFEHARALALDVATFEACLHAAATSSVIEEHRALYRSTGSQRLPLTYVGDRVIDGAPPSPVVVQAFLDALAPRRVRVASWVFALGLLLAVSAVVVLTRDRRGQSRAVRAAAKHQSQHTDPEPPADSRR